jgi:hypothetical protein
MMNGSLFDILTTQGPQYGESHRREGAGKQGYETRLPEICRKRIVAPLPNHLYDHPDHYWS